MGPATVRHIHSALQGACKLYLLRETRPTTAQQHQPLTKALPQLVLDRTPELSVTINVGVKAGQRQIKNVNFRLNRNRTALPARQLSNPPATTPAR